MPRAFPMRQQPKRNEVKKIEPNVQNLKHYPSLEGKINIINILILFKIDCNAGVGINNA